MRTRPSGGQQHEEHVDGGARADGGHHRDALGGGADEAARLLVERTHQLALGEPDQVAAVDDVVEMALQPRPGAGEARHPLGEGEEVAHQGAARGALVAGEDGDRPGVQAFDGAEAGETDRLARDDREQRDAGHDREKEPGAAEPGGAARELLDQVDDGEAGREHGQPEHADPEHRRPGRAGLGLGRARHLGLAARPRGPPRSRPRDRRT